MNRLFLIFAFVIPVIAASRTYQENVINIEGCAKLKVIPNVAEIEIGVSADHTDADSAVLLCAQKFGTFMSLLKDYKFADDDIKSTRFSVTRNWDYVDGKREETGYLAKKMYKITIRDISKLKDFLYRATTSGINAFDDLEFTHNKLDSLKRAIVDMAIEDANRMANRVADRMGVKVGKPLVISNAEPKEFSYENRVQIGWVSPPRFVKGGAKLEEKSAEPKDLKFLEEFFSINPGLIEIENKVYVTYELKR